MDAIDYGLVVAVLVLALTHVVAWRRHRRRLWLMDRLSREP